VSGIFGVTLRIFLLGAVVAGVGWIGMYVGLSYSLGAEVAERIGSAGTKALIGVVMVVAAGLAIKTGVTKLRAARAG
jgi:membrane protein DedA with SNARE-associated domain